MLAWDVRALLWINGHRHPSVDAVLYPVSVAGEKGLLLALTLVAVLWWPPRHGRGRAPRLEWALVGVALLLADRLLFEAITLFLFRERPFLALDGVRQAGPVWITSSFPSGHAHYSWLVTLVLGARYRAALWLLVPFSVLTCYARPYFGMHYPLDVLAGSVLGLAAGWAVIRVRRAWEWRADQPVPGDAPVFPSGGMAGRMGMGGG